MNPITDLIRSGMETYTQRENSFVDRVSENAINAQKLFDERHGPHKAHMFWRDDPRLRIYNNLYLANSAFKGMEDGAGCINSFKAHRYYSKKAADRRDALLEKIKKEG